MKSKILILLSLVLSLAVFVACGQNSGKNNSNVINEGNSNKASENDTEDSVKDPLEVQVVSPAGSPTISMVKMFKENPKIDNANIKYTMTLTTDELQAKLVSKEADFAVVPTNLAAKLYNKGIEYTLAAPVVWGNLYLIGNEKINDLNELKGKEIYTIGKGLTPDILFRHLLEANGIDPDNDVKLTYLSGGSELASNYIAGKSNLTIMPEPMLTIVKSKKTETELIMDLQEEWNKQNGSKLGYPQASLIVKTKLVEENKEFVENFIQEFENSVQWLEKDSSTAGIYYNELVTSIDGKVVEKSLPGSNIKYKDAEDVKVDIEKYLNILMDFSKDSIGGKLPDEGFYLEK
ncbi:ABC transporter substrate-binding protein [Clostridium sediminicola]|uniref:ABC transporter substrate-binding protein n=1 Tax=Clostridium sediminicola TaxID=3114879 RepID=UPI0031F20571